jgi:hypothetical protein
VAGVFDDRDLISIWLGLDPVRAHGRLSRPPARGHRLFWPEPISLPVPAARPLPVLLLQCYVNRRVLDTRRAGLALATACCMVVAIPLLLKWAPHWLASGNGLSPPDRAADVGRVRTSLLALAAGVVAVVGAIYTGRTYRINQKALELSRQGQITDRFTRAIDQLGASNEVEVRLGGIHALARIARESPSDHGPIMDILTAYVRERASLPGSGPSATSGTPGSTRDGEPETQPPRPSLDVQTVLTVIIRRAVAHDPVGWPIELEYVDLAGAQLRPVTLARAHLTGSNLRWANLKGSDLRHARLQHCNMRHAELQRADLEGAMLQGAELQDANLEWANLAGAQLACSRIEGASFRGAAYSATTTWPKGTDLHKLGLRLIGEAPIGQ